MNRRFEIDELVAQDAFRVVYRALDRQTGGWVAVLRLLPRGHAGGGLDEVGVERFEAAAAVLAGVDCPALRRVVAWGADPIDRMPYVVTEWVDGESVAGLLRRGVLSDEAARRLTESGLAAQAALDAAGGGWRVDLAAEEVVLVGGDDGYRFSFWVASLPGPEPSAEVVGELAGLVERALGWHGLVPASTAGGGLAGWIRAVRQSRPDAARALLELAAIGAQARVAAAGPATAGGMVGPATAGGRGVPRAPVSGPAGMPAVVPAPGGGGGRAIWWVAAACGVLALGLGGWWFMKSGSRGGGAGPAAATGGSTAGVSQQGGHDAGMSADQQAAAASRRAAELARQMAESGTLDGPVRVFGPGDGSQLRAWIDREVILKGVVREVRDSSSGKSRYLEFSATRGVDDICGRMSARDDQQGLSRPALQPLVGRMVALHGVVRVEPGTGRLVIHLDARDQIEELAPGAQPTPRKPRAVAP